jgi:hypothetical protein
MTIEIGDTLVIGTNNGVDSRRLRYTGEGKASLELFYPHTNRWSDEGVVEAMKVVKLTPDQIKFWLSKKG